MELLFKSFGPDKRPCQSPWRKSDSISSTSPISSMSTPQEGSSSDIPYFSQEILTPTELTLVELSKQFITLLNDRKFEDAHALQNEILLGFGVSPDFTAQLLNYPTISSWGGYVESFRDMVAEWPEYNIRLAYATASVDNVRDKADVFLLAEETGRPVGVRTVAPSRLSWVKVGETWLLIKHLMFRGASLPL